MLQSRILAGLAAVVLATSGRPSQGQEALNAPRPAALTLKDCIAIAVQQNASIEASRLDVASATEEERAIRGEYLPKVTGNAGVERFYGSSTGLFSIVNEGTNVGISPNGNVSTGAVELYSAHLSYPLFKDGSILGLNNGPALAGAQAKKRNLAWTQRLRREEVVDRVADSYITTVSAINRSGFAARRVKLLELQANITEEQQKQGLTLPIDLKLVRSQLSGARNLSAILQEQAVAGRIEMAKWLGLSGPNELNLSNELPEPPPPPSAARLLGASLSQHPALQAQLAVIDQAKQDYRLERFRLYPSVNFNATAAYIDDFGSADSTLFTGGFTVTVPVFDFGSQLATTRSKLLKYKAEKARLSSVTDDVTFEVVKIYEDIYVLSQNILSLQDEVAKAERDVQVTSSQQQQGIATPLAAIEKELHLIARRDDLEGLEVRRLVLYAALQKAAGGSWKWVE